MVTASRDKTLRLYDMKTGDAVRVLTGHTAFVACVAVTPDGRRAISGSFDRALRVWDLETAECLASFSAGEPVQACGAGMDGTFIVALSGPVSAAVRKDGSETGRSGANIAQPRTQWRTGYSALRC